MRPGRRAVVYDLDRVLLDSERFEEARRQSAQELGVDLVVFDETYKKTRLPVYKPVRHARLLARHLKDHCRWNLSLDVITSIILKNLNFAPLNSLEDFIFEDARRVLCAVCRKQSVVDPYILSSGDRLFQALKIQASGLYEFFTLPSGPDIPRIFVTEKNKGPFIREIAKSHDAILYYDDMLSQLESVSRYMRNSGMAKYPICYVQIDRRPEIKKEFWEEKGFGSMRGIANELDVSDLDILEKLGGHRGKK